MITPQVAAIYTSIEFIENHLKEEITLEDIAAAAGYSLYHFIRTFNQFVHHTPYDYLMRRRLSESARELVESSRRILDIALEYQFNNHETYSRAFKRMFAMQPKQWRSRGLIPYRTLLPSLSLSYLGYINKVGIPKPQFIERNTTDLVGLMNKGDENVIELWQNLRWMLEEHQYFKKASGFYGIHMVLGNKTSFYFVGIDTFPGDKIMPPYSTLQLPSGTYIEFCHRGMREDLPLSLDYIYHTWLAKLNYQLTHFLEIEYFSNKIPLPDGRIKNWQIQLPINV